MIIQQIDFQTIEPIWRERLWPGRVSAIEPYSAMMFMHDAYDASFADQDQIFLGGFVNDELVAVNSLHQAEKYMCRSRGLWVAPEVRGRSFGTRMLTITNNYAKKLGAESIWSFSRISSISTYLKAGYVRTSNWMNHGEYGPNAYVLCTLYNKDFGQTGSENSSF